MNPTLKDGQKLIMKKFQKNDKLHRGDVVIIKVTLKDKEYDFIKRVIALPGEHLEIKNHKVYINGKYMTNIYQNYNINFYIELKLVKKSY